MYKKLLATILTIVMMLALLPAVAQPAYAAHDANTIDLSLITDWDTPITNTNWRYDVITDASGTHRIFWVAANATISVIGEAESLPPDGILFQANGGATINWDAIADDKTGTLATVVNITPNVGSPFTVNVMGGKIKGNGTALYVTTGNIINVSGGELEGSTALGTSGSKVTVTGGTLTGQPTAITNTNGEVVISGGTINGAVYGVSWALTNTASDSGTGWVWDHASLTLTLTNLNYSSLTANALNLPAGSTIVLNGTNSITSNFTGTGQLSNGINVDGALTIKGSGSLSATGGFSSSAISSGINTSGVFTVDSSFTGTINATGGSPSYVSHGISAPYAVFSGGTINAKSGAVVSSTSSNGLFTTIAPYFTINNPGTTVIMAGATGAFTASPSAGTASVYLVPAGYLYEVYSDVAATTLQASGTSDGTYTVYSGRDDPRKYVKITAALPKYTVTYNGNGFSGGAVPVDNTQYTSGTSVTVLGNTGSLVRTGFAFDGWNTQADGLGTSYASGATFNITANTTLYAKWRTLSAATDITSVAGQAVTWGGGSGATSTAPKTASVNVANGVTSITAANITRSANSTVVVTGGTLAVGANTVLIEVTAEDGTTKMYYELTVTRAAGGGSGGGTPAYNVLEHFGTWYGSGNITARINADHEKFSHLTRGGSVVHASNYFTRSGSTIITLRESHLQTLSSGRHVFVAHFIDGYSEEIILTVYGGANTGDSANLQLWWLALLYSVFGLMFVYGTSRFLSRRQGFSR